MRYIQLGCLMMISTCAYAQTYAQTEKGIVLKDSISAESNHIIDSQKPFEMAKDSIDIKPDLTLPYMPVFPNSGMSEFGNYAPLDLPFYSFTPGEATVFGWGSGRIVAHGFTTVFPELMRIDSGSIGLYQNIGNFSIYAGGMANKYGFIRGIHTQFGVNGSITYRFNDRLSATAFGTYYFGRPPKMANGAPMPPAMIGFYNVSRFGGYVDYGVSENFGVEVGAQAVQTIGTSKYKPEPIVTPYIKAGNGKVKVKVGLPVGQILYHAIRKR